MNFFVQQEQARSKTKLLVFYFLIAVVATGLVMSAIFYYIFFYSSEFPRDPQSIAEYASEVGWQVFVATIGTILIASVLKSLLLSSGGGEKVALSVGATPIDSRSKDPKIRRFINVVDEMSIASGTPRPKLFIMAHEDNINAFAAGYTPQEAVIAVTSGALNQLNRAELQGLVAHEYSHIFNGDMRLNIRLIGLLFGVLFISQIGEFLLRSSGRRSNSKNSGGVLPLGLALFVVGIIGYFAGRLIKAAISRQREFLADASAVQYTRDPQTIAGCLKKILVNPSLSQIDNKNRQELSHMFFSNGSSLKAHSNSLLATHPPLGIRIQRVDKNFRLEEFLKEHKLVSTKQQSSSFSDDASHPLVSQFSNGLSAAVVSETLTDLVASPQPKHLKRAQQIVDKLEPLKRSLLRNNDATMATVYAFFTNAKNNKYKNQQLQSIITLESSNFVEEYKKAVDFVAQIPRDEKLESFEYCIAQLELSTDSEKRKLLALIWDLIHIDQVYTLEEYCYFTILESQLNTSLYPNHYKQINQAELMRDMSVVVSMLVNSSSTRADLKQTHYYKAMKHLDANFSNKPLYNVDFDSFNLALSHISLMRPSKKETLISAIGTLVLADRQATVEEKELVRAIALSIKCPLPSLLV